MHSNTLFMIHNNFFFIAHTLFLLSNFSLTTLVLTLVRRSVLPDPRTEDADCHTSDIGHWFAMTRGQRPFAP